MYKIIAQIETDGNKKDIYELKEAIMRIGSQNSCHLNITISSSEGFQESISASFTSIVDVSAEDIIDLTLSGEEQYELLIHKETEKTE